MNAKKLWLASASCLLLVSPCVERVAAFCGFYVAAADTKLFNKSSQVVLVRDGDRTVLTMANDFRGDPKAFAVVIPVPTVLERGQVHVGDEALIDHLDAYSAPRLVEYFDADPCLPIPRMAAPMARMMDSAAVAGAAGGTAAKALGVTIEASYTVGEYNILILSAKQSTGLETWLRENGYRIPPGAAPVLASYIRQNLKFFVAKVNLEQQAKLGFTYLRPLQVAYESPKFMLPIRLGMVNADGPQELFVYTLTRTGRVETTNYRTVKLPTGVELPLYVKQDFPVFYKALFNEQVRRAGMQAIFTEYAWNMTWCDPCAAPPLAQDELRRLGVFWSDGRPDVFLTRLHVRYDAAHYPEDLVFQETGDRATFQGRYVLRHEWTGTSSCSAAAEYRRTLTGRHEREAEQLATLTGWNIADIRSRMQITPERWWERIW